MSKGVFITGGSSGFGLELARFYAQAGNDVLLLARGEEKLQSAVASCSDCCREGQTFAGETLDITAFDALPARMEALMSRYGVPDILILSAGAAFNKTFLDTGREEFDWLVNTNLAGSREVVRAVLPGMLARGSGQIAFISSLAGLIGVYGYSAYSASKFALTGFSKALRQELFGTGVSVNLVCPPEVDTPLVEEEASGILPQTRFIKDMTGTLSAAVAAKKIAAGLNRNKMLIIPGLEANLTAKIARHFPRLFSKSTELLLRWKFQ